jgi:predicted house-cleaning noncanonical NTP pyrophosphatase (MazG superfamily)
MKKLRFHIEAIIGDRYESTDSLTKDEVHEWLLNMQKQDILKVETKNEYWEDIPQNLFELFKTNIKDKNYEYTMAKGHLWLEIEISIEP